MTNTTNCSFAIKKSSTDKEASELRRLKRLETRDDIQILDKLIARPSASTKPNNTNSAKAKESFQFIHEIVNTKSQEVKCDGKDAEVSAKCLRNRNKRRNRQLKVFILR